jgi:transposase InsO family protein
VQSEESWAAAPAAEQAREIEELKGFYPEWRRNLGELRDHAFSLFDQQHKMPREMAKRILDRMLASEVSHRMGEGRVQFRLVPREDEVYDLIDAFWRDVSWRNIQGMTHRTTAWAKKILRSRGIDPDTKGQKVEMQPHQVDHLRGLVTKANIGYKCAARSINRECVREGRPWDIISQQQAYLWMKEEGFLESPGKSHTKSEEVLHYEAKWAGELWHTDTKVSIMIDGKTQHLVAFIDDKSRYVVSVEVVPTKHAALAGAAFTKAIGIAKSLGVGPPDRINTDNGTEFKGEFKKVAEENGIKISLSRPHHPQTNGKMETWWAKIMHLLPSDEELTTELLREYVELYNDRKVHTALDHLDRGDLVPSDVFFSKEWRFEGHREDLGCTQWTEVKKVRGRR